MNILKSHLLLLLLLLLDFAVGNFHFDKQPENLCMGAPIYYIRPPIYDMGGVLYGIVDEYVAIFTSILVILEVVYTLCCDE